MEDMSILARDKNQLTYIYSSQSHLGKQVLGYVQGIDKKVEVIDISKEKIGDTIWVEIADNVGLPLGKLFESLQGDLSKSENFTTDDWLKIINKSPELLQKPIALNGAKAMVVAHRSEILRFFGVDSAGLKKTFSHEPPTTKPTTKDENFM